MYLSDAFKQVLFNKYPQEMLVPLIFSHDGSYTYPEDIREFPVLLMGCSKFSLRFRNNRDLIPGLMTI